MKKLAEQLRALYTAQITALNGLDEFMTQMPPAVAAEVKKMKDSINEMLKGLPPLDQIPAANDAAWALENFAAAMSRMAEYTTQLYAGLQATHAALREKTTALQSLEARVTSKDLVDKTTADAAVELARKEGAATMLPEIMATRRMALQGLPDPGEAVLGLPAAEFQGRLTQATSNLAALKEKGLSLDGTGKAFANKSVWMVATEFAGQMDVIADFQPAPKAEAKPATADPLVGNAPEEDKGGKGVF